MARRRPVILVTHVRNRQAIEAAGQTPINTEILYIDTEWFAGPLFRLARKLFPRSEHGVFLIASLDFFLFDRLALRALRALRKRQHAGSPMSLVHVVTPVTLAAPSALHKLGLPLVRGPLNCGLQSPKGFDQQLRDENPWVIRLRKLPRVLDTIIGATRNADMVLTATQATLMDVPPRHRSKTLMMLENGIDLEHFPATPWPPAPGNKQALRILFVGRMIALKGVDMLLEAVYKLRQRGIPVELTLIGDGPARENWQQLAASLMLTECVRFTGALARDDVQREMSACHVFCLPSIRESGGAVLLEAMASARPVIAMNHGGPAELVDDAVGRAIAVQDAAQVIADLACALADVVAEPAAWAQRGAHGRSRVEHFYDWEQKISSAEEIYQRLSPGCHPDSIEMTTDNVELWR